MPRRRRIHIPGGTYYIVQRGGGDHPLFSGPQDDALLATLLPTALHRMSGRLHAYCWVPNALHFLLQVDEAPAGDFMREVSSQYARVAQRRVGKTGSLFQHRYHAVLIDPDAYLLKLIQYLHHLPVLDGLAPGPDQYLYTSHQAYLGRVHLPWMHTRTALQILDSFDEDRIAYRTLMAQPPARQALALFERGDAATPGILGSTDFVEHLPRGAKPERSRLTLEQIIRIVTRSQGLSRDEVMSRSHGQDLSLARARIAWYAMERRVATLSDVARYLRRNPSTLSRAIRRQRKRWPELFALDAFHYMAPLVDVEDAPEPGNALFQQHSLSL